MFVELNEVIAKDGEEVQNTIHINVRYIGVVFEQDGKTILSLDSTVLPDRYSQVAESREEVMRKIDAALYGNVLAEAPIV